MTVGNEAPAARDLVRERVMAMLAETLRLHDELADLLVAFAALEDDITESAHLADPYERVAGILRLMAERLHHFVPNASTTTISPLALQLAREDAALFVRDVPDHHGDPATATTPWDAGPSPSDA